MNKTANYKFINFIGLVSNSEREVAGGKLNRAANIPVILLKLTGN